MVTSRVGVAWGLNAYSESAISNLTSDMILVLDNYDSFTYNLVQYLGEMTTDIEVRRNDKVTVEEIRRMAPRAIVVSPGPGVPESAGISIDLVRELGPTIPLLGVCLGHQAIARAYGAEVVRGPSPVHGKTSSILHRGEGLFRGLPIPFQATRYHSLLIERDSLPRDLKVTAWTPDGLVMGVAHSKHPVQGVQFHPESILTDHGHSILARFLEMAHQEPQTAE